MAVVQISQIQVRKGLLQDLGQLAGGEFGWAVDKLRLFIGNGTIAEGAPYEGMTEIFGANTNLMELSSSYIFKGLLGGYQVITGPNGASPVERGIQAKLDDIVNVKDFGAAGDGTTDDTAAIQRSIDEIYNRLGNFTNYNTRRAINFYPGVYLINGELRIPPFCRLQGTNKGSVIIRQVGPAASCSFKTTNSVGSYDNAIPNAGLPPGNVFISDIEFQTNYDVPIGILESTTDVTFNRCKFIGIRNNPTTVSASAGIVIYSNYLASRNINFVDCDFSRFTSGVLSYDNIETSDISFNRCTFANLYRGLQLLTSNTNVSVSAARITNSVFDRISNEAIFANVNSVITSLNVFLPNVGCNFTNTAITSVIHFGGNSNYSMADLFYRSEYQDYVYPTVMHGKQETISFSTKNTIRLGNVYQTLGKSHILNNNSSNYIPLPPRLQHGVIQYSLERNTDYRSGVIQFNSDINSVGCHYRDSFTQSSDLGIDLKLVYYSVDGIGRPIFVANTDNRGTISALTFDVKSII